MFRYITHEYKRKKLWFTLFKNYILMFIIMIAAISIASYLVLFISNEYFFNAKFLSLYKYNLSAEEIMEDDYKEIDTSSIEELQGSIEIVNNDFKVIYSKGNKDLINSSYSLKSYTEAIELTSVNGNICMAKYNEKKNFTLIVKLPENKVKNLFIHHPRMGYKTFILVAVLIYALCIIAVPLGFVAATSKQFIRPWRKLLDGVERISEGDYNVYIEDDSDTEIGDLIDAFNKMAVKIEESRNIKEESEELRRSLFLGISHDLKNPLASVLGYSELLINDGDIKEDDKIRYLEIINRNSRRANELIIDLFELSKIESYDYKLDKKNIDFGEFLRVFVASYITIMEENAVEYDFDIPEEAIFYEIDTREMDRAISNLILNSIKYNEPGITIKIALKESQEQLILSVEDNGKGIPKDSIDTIFEPFVRAEQKTTSKKSGTGLGLAITKAIVEKHNGTVEVENLKFGGCRFTIKFAKANFLK